MKGVYIDEKAQTILTEEKGDKHRYNIVSGTILYIETGEDTLKYIKTED